MDEKGEFQVLRRRLPCFLKYYSNLPRRIQYMAGKKFFKMSEKIAAVFPRGINFPYLFHAKG